MLEQLKKLNPDIPLYSVNDSEFKSFGRVVQTLTQPKSSPPQRRLHDRLKVRPTRRARKTLKSLKLPSR